MSFYILDTPYGDQIVMKIDDVVSFIPDDLDNYYYQKYLSWVDSGNIPKLFKY